MYFTRPTLALHEVTAMLADLFARPVSGLRPIDSGQIARVFRFQVGSQGYVIRFSGPELAATLAKERFIIEELLPAGIPVPRIERLGQWQDFAYMVMEEAPGVHLEQVSHQERVRLLPEQLAVLLRLHQTDVSGYSGYGYFGASGRGDLASWTTFLAQVREEEEEGGFYGRWHHLFADTFLERPYFDDLFDRMAALFPLCPENRYLVHADYGFSNVLVQNGRITAVLDWANALYGDFLFDIAWLDLWLVGGQVKERTRPVYSAAKMPLQHYEERILCYQHYIALDGMRFYAKTNQPHAYRFAKERLKQLL